MSTGGDGGGAGGGGSEADVFVPKEDLVAALTNLGISRNAAVRALFLTGNYSADLAAAYIFENADENLDAPLESLIAQGVQDSDSDDDVEDYAGAPLYKMVLIVNKDLGMGLGKTAGQTAHAAVGLYRLMIEEQQRYGEMLLNWEQFGETKIVLKGNNAAHLQELRAKAAVLELATFAVQDAGRTQIAPGSLTVLAVMGKVEIVDQVTGQLPLL